MRLRTKASLTIFVSILSVALLLASSVSVTAWQGFHNDKFRTGHIATDASDISTDGMNAEFTDPNCYVASPVAAPYSATYDSQSQEWTYGDWRVVSSGDYRVVAYDENLEHQWTFYTSSPVVSTPAICVLTGRRVAGDPSIEGARAAIIMTRGHIGVESGMIHVVGLETGELILEMAIPADWDGVEDPMIETQRMYSFSSPVCHSEWVDNQHGKVQIFYIVKQEIVYGPDYSSWRNIFCRITMEYNTVSDEWEWAPDEWHPFEVRVLTQYGIGGDTIFSSPIILDNGFVAFTGFRGRLIILDKDDFWDSRPNIYNVDLDGGAKYTSVAELPTIINSGYTDCHYFVAGFDGYSSFHGPGLSFVRMRNTATPGEYDVEVTDTIEFETGDFWASSPCILTRTDVTRTVGEEEYDFEDELFPDAVFFFTTNKLVNQVTKVRAISTTVEDVSGDLRIVFSDTQSDPITIASGKNVMCPSAPICTDSQLYVGIGQHMYMGDITFNGEQVSLTNMASFQSVGQGDSFSARPMLLEQTLTTTQGGEEDCVGLSLYNVATDGRIFKWDTTDTTYEGTDSIEWFSFQSVRRIHDLAAGSNPLDSYVNDRHPTVVREDVTVSSIAKPVFVISKYLISSPVVAIMEPNNQVWDPDHVIIQAVYNRVYGLNEDLTVRWVHGFSQIIKGTPIVFRIDDAVGEDEYHKYAVFIVTYGEDWHREDWAYARTENDRPWEVLLDASDGSLIDERQVFHDDIGQSLLGGGPAPDENWFYVHSSPLHYMHTEQRDQQLVTIHRLFFTVQYIYAIHPSTLGAEHIFCRLTVEKVNGKWKFIDDNMGFDPSYEKWREYGVPHYHDNKPCYSSPTWTVVDKGQGMEPAMIAVGNNDGKVYFFNWESFWLQPGDLRDFSFVDITPAVVLYSTGAYSAPDQSLYIGVDEYGLNPAGYFTSGLHRIDLAWGQFGQPWPYVKATKGDEEELSYRYISSPSLFPTDDPNPPIAGMTEYVFVLTTDLADPEEEQHGGNPGMDSELHMMDANGPMMLIEVDSEYVFSGPMVFDDIPSSPVCTDEQVYCGIGPEMYIGGIGADVITNWMSFALVPDGTFCASPAIFPFTTGVVVLYRLVNMCTDGKIYKWIE
jgi:hypothetical protein